MQDSSTKALVYGGVFTALAILLTYVFAIQTPFVRITFGFLPLALYGALFGPWRAGIVGALTDIIGSILLGGSTFFPGFALSGYLTGWIYGWFLHTKRHITWKTAWLPFLLVMCLIHLGLNTLWLVLYYDKAAGAIFFSRLLKNLLCYPLEVSLFLLVYQHVLPLQAPKRDCSPIKR